jgi:hypothetical protein
MRNSTEDEVAYVYVTTNVAQPEQAAVMLARVQDRNEMYLSSNRKGF